MDWILEFIETLNILIYWFGINSLCIVDVSQVKKYWRVLVKPIKFNQVFSWNIFSLWSVLEDAEAS